MWHRAQMLQQTQVFFHFYGLIRLCSSFAAFVFYDSFACSMAPNSIHTISTNTNFHSVRDCLTQCHRFFFPFSPFLLLLPRVCAWVPFYIFCWLFRFRRATILFLFSLSVFVHIFFFSFRHLFRYNNLFTM